MLSRRMIRLQRSPNSSSVLLIGHPERRWLIASILKNRLQNRGGFLSGRTASTVFGANECDLRVATGSQHMAKLVFGMNQSLDGYVDYDRLGAEPQSCSATSSSRCGTSRQSLRSSPLRDSWRYWDEDQADWDDAERDFAVAWRKSPKWVVSRTLKSVGPNATLLGADLEAEVRRLKAEHDGDIEVGGPVLARAPDRTWADRRIPHLPPPRRARSRRAVLRWSAAARSALPPASRSTTMC